MSAPAPRRIGMFGGAFDPPHAAHTALARCAVEQLALDELRIFPTGHAWHKDRTTTDAAHRLQMARLAFEGLPRVVVDDREMLRAGPTYTVDTLRELKDQFPAAELFLVLGTDQAAAFASWHQAGAILELATISIAGRAGAARSGGLFDPEFAAAARFAPVAMPPMDVSATAIRARLTAGLEAGDALAPAVASYIARHHLYQTR